MIANQEYTLVTNLGQEGLLLEDVAILIKKPTSTSFEEIGLLEEDFQEAEAGYYNIKISSSLLDQLGTYVFNITGYELEIFEERENLPRPLSSTPAPDTCIVTGNARNLAGQAEVFRNIVITARPVKLPAVFNGTLTLGQRVDTRSDFDGFFSIPVIRGAEVRFEIQSAGVRFQAVIPDQDTIRIEELMPNS